jgi:hypothetical protein
MPSEYRVRMLVRTGDDHWSWIPVSQTFATIDEAREWAEMLNTDDPRIEEE